MNLRDEIWSLEESGCKKPLVMVTIEDDLSWLILLQDAEYILFECVTSVCISIDDSFFHDKVNGWTRSYPLRILIN